MSLVQIKGTPLITFGTGGLLNVPAGAIVDSLQLTPKNGEPIEIEDGNGLTIVEVLLRDGFNAKLAVLYDGNKTWPVEGANAVLTIPYSGAAANSIPFGEAVTNGGNATYNANTVAYTVLIASVSPAYKKKGEAMLDFNVTYRPQVAV